MWQVDSTGCVAVEGLPTAIGRRAKFWSSETERHTKKHMPRRLDWLTREGGERFGDSSVVYFVLNVEGSTSMRRCQARCTLGNGF